MHHHYLFFDLLPEFYQLPEADRSTHKKELQKIFADPTLTLDTFTTLGLKAGTTFMVWTRADTPEAMPNWLRRLFGTRIGTYLRLSFTYAGLARESTYSGRRGNPEQDMEQFTTRLPYFVMYPFVKSHEWHQLSFENRKAIMGQHVKMGLSFPEIRQCLLYSYGIDDYEFIVSYEMESLPKFQDLVMAMRNLVGRQYTLSDTPIYTCIYKPAKELVEWL